jgi:hypothetical protein
MMKHLMEIDEWVSKREGYSYTMTVNSFGTDFWVYNHRTNKGQTVQSTAQLNENKLNNVESVKCEKLEEVK